MFHILFSADENYIKYTAVLITSIIHNTNTKLNFKDFCQKEGFQAPNNSSFSTYKNRDFNTLSKEEQQEGYVFHILSNAISKATQNKLKQLQNTLNSIYPCEILIHIMTDDAFASFPISGSAHSNYLTYYRLRLDSFLKSSVAKCLYLDSDMLCLCDLRELFAIDLKDNILAAINDPGTKKRKIKYKENGKNVIFNFDDNYFNAGFLLINTNSYRKHKIQEQCETLAKKCYYIKAADQDLLNATIPQDKLLKLPIAYNFSSISFCISICKDEKKHRLNCTRAEFMESYRNPKIIHYGEKPWKFLQSYVDSKGENINTFWWHYAKKTPSFSQELLESKNTIKEYLHFASLGFKVLELSSKLTGYFALKALIKTPQNDKNLNVEVPQELFGLCCILGETILYARKHKKGALSVLLKALKIKRNFESFNTQKFNQKI
ncbi:glycosyltransferase family 8 protein [Helicobacter turcicus]|uniref:Glycosyltransferase family 8 protein n=1 Tax=Helicobacter turcicus TaxID=2867412 RepID=A0ABS7JM10_9HELI|nr:glycosyltransferase family 8 protein [Helicobacter turcicus]MBX7490428.1 glycosyltransferase family 8 protein [Helicobacter turcicus]MBX7545287.1 glycosyltransferase family 8 protein [Helicobacter turcicus]